MTLSIEFGKKPLALKINRTW